MTERCRPWRRVISRCLSLPVRAKIMGIVLGVILLLAGVVAAQIRTTLKTTMREELRRRGISVARDVAGRATDLLLTDNLFAVNQLLRNRLENDSDIRYVFLTDSSGKLVAHTFAHGFPSDLLKANSLTPGGGTNVEVLDTEEGLIYDAAAPILEGRLGTARVGMSERRVRTELAVTTQFLLLVTGAVSLIGVAAAYVLAFVVTTPIRNLVKVTQAVGHGDFSQRASVWTDDEIGSLGKAFNSMIQALNISRREIEQSNQQLIRRNEELSALNAVAFTASQSLELREILHSTLTKVLEAVRARAGWVFLAQNESDSLTLAACQGISKQFEQEEFNRPLGQCICREVIRTGATRIIEDMTTCTRLSQNVLEHEGLKWHASIPLKAKDRVLGILNVGFDRQGPFCAEDLRLLGAIGHQVGIAIENARLYERVQQKDAVRRRLLDKLIRAQEEERKRIARELHDQVGQGLTATIMRLGSVERTLSSQPRQAECQIGEIRTLVSSIVKQVRGLMTDLRPSLLDDLGLIPAIRSCAEAHLEPAGVRVRVAVEGLRRKLPSAVEIALFRIVQEAVMNIAKHAQASSASICLRFGQDCISAWVEDDGKGFDTEQRGLDVYSFGILGMEERATLLGGSFQLRSQPGCGTRIIVRVPVPTED